MHLKKARFAALCGVSRPSIGDSVKRGSLHCIDGLIDLSDPLNLAYLAKHAPLKAQELQQTGNIVGVTISEQPPDDSPSGGKSQAIKKKLAPIRAKERESQSDDAEFTPPQRRSTPAQSTDDDGDGPSLAGLTEAEAAEAVRKPLYDARKARLSAEKEAVNLDLLHKSLGEREFFDELIQQRWQAMRQNYIDVAPKQAARVCKRLGMVGHELEVIEVLEGDIKKRQDNVAKAVSDVLKMRLINPTGKEMVEE